MFPYIYFKIIVVTNPVGFSAAGRVRWKICIPHISTLPPEGFPKFSLNKFNHNNILINSEIEFFIEFPT